VGQHLVTQRKEISALHATNDFLYIITLLLKYSQQTLRTESLMTNFLAHFLVLGTKSNTVVEEKRAFKSKFLEKKSAKCTSRVQEFEHLNYIAVNHK